MGKMADVDHDLIEPVARQMLDQILHDGFSQNRDHGFGHHMGQRSYPCAFTRGEDHRFHLCIPWHWLEIL